MSLTNSAAGAAAAAEDRVLGPGDDARLSRALVDCYFAGHNGQTGRQLVAHQLDSYNDFVMRLMEQIIEGFNPVDICNKYDPEHGCHQYVLSLEVSNPRLSKPQVHEKDGSTKVMMPNDARLRNLTYAAPLTVDLHVTAKTYSPEAGAYVSDTKRINSVALGRIPVMVRSRYCMLSQPLAAMHVSASSASGPSGTSGASGVPPEAPHQCMDECKYDYGGYFVINGSEKVVISQDRIAENRTYVFVNTKASCYSLVAEIRSVQEARFGVPKTLTIKLASRANNFGRPIKLSMHHVKHDVPVFVLFRALGVETDRDIVRLIVQDPDDPAAAQMEAELVGSMDDGSGLRTSREALEYLAQHLAMPHHQQHCSTSLHQRMNALRNVLRKDLLPHVGPEPLKKALYLGHMVRRLLKVHLGLSPVDDRDSYINKRLDTPGVLLANLFRQYYGKVIKDMRTLVQKDINRGAWRATNKFINVIGKSNVYKLIKATIIEAGLKYGLATGNWGVKTSRPRQGVAQVLNRMTYVATLSHLRRINTAIEKTGKLVQPRKLHATQWGVVCPSETPEGASVGLVKNMALTTSITIATSSDPVRRALADMNVLAPKARTFIHGGEAAGEGEGAGEGAGEGEGEGEGMVTTDVLAPQTSPARKSGRMTRIYVNGDLVGTHADPDRLYRSLKELKRCGTLSVYTSIVWNVLGHEMTLCTEGGRFVRPLLVAGRQGRLEIADPRHARLLEGLLARSARASAASASASEDTTDAAGPQWHQLVLAGVIEYLDVEESNHALIALLPSDVAQPQTQTQTLKSYTHAEVSPYAMLGVVAGSIPFSDHNQAPRNTYQSAMGKQAIGIYALNFRHRFDTMVHVLSYPQRPMVSTHTARILNCDRLPCGVNAIVAIACFTGFNQEDSVIVNQSAVDRGLLVSTFYRTFREQNNKNHSTGEEEFFCRPDPATTRNMKPHNYGKLGASGFVDENTHVEVGDVLVGKCMPQKQKQGQVIFNKDVSMALKSNERGFVDRNCYGNRHFTNVTGDGYTFAKVRLRQERVPSIGDKVSCYTGDHEVLTESHGWVSVADVYAGAETGPGHRVATLTYEGTLMYQRPYAVQRYVHQGPLVHVLGPGVDLVVTPQHRLWTRRPPSRSARSARSSQPARGPDRPEEEPLRSSVPVAWRKGHDARYLEHLSHGVEVAGFVADEDEEMGGAWRMYAKRVPCPWGGGPWTEGPVVTSVAGRIAAQPDASSWLQVLGAWIVEREVTHDRTDLASRPGRLPEWVWRLDPQHASWLLSGMFIQASGGATSASTAGAVPKAGTPPTIVLRRADMAGAVQRLCLHAGVAADVERRVSPLDGLAEHAVRLWAPGLDEWAQPVARAVFGAEEATEVFCVSVAEGPGVVFVRRNGVATWCGNSRHGQKGTIGMLYREEDMPFTSGGIVPSLIMNPHAIPSRMTIGQLMEALESKAGALSGALGDASPFNRRTVEDIAAELEGLGAERYGDEIMYNPRTGEQVPCAVFVCPTYYQRLKHMVVDKVHSRAANGPVVLLTRQPAEGRARDGGLRLGEMELECLWAHGSMYFLKERFMECSDNYRVFVCTLCGMMATVSPEHGIYFCKACKNITEFAEVRIPYASKLFLQEIQTMAIGARFQLQPFLSHGNAPPLGGGAPMGAKA